MSNEIKTAPPMSANAPQEQINRPREQKNYSGSGTANVTSPQRRRRPRRNSRGESRGATSTNAESGASKTAPTPQKSRRHRSRRKRPSSTATLEKTNHSQPIRDSHHAVADHGQGDAPSTRRDGGRTPLKRRRQRPHPISELSESLQSSKTRIANHPPARHEAERIHHTKRATTPSKQTYSADRRATRSLNNKATDSRPNHDRSKAPQSSFRVRRQTRPAEAYQEARNESLTTSNSSPHRSSPREGLAAPPQGNTYSPPRPQYHAGLDFPDESSWEATDLNPVIQPLLEQKRSPISSAKAKKEHEPSEAHSKEKNREANIEGRPPGEASILHFTPPKLDPDGDDEYDAIMPDQPACSGILYNMVMVRLGDNAKASPFDAGELCPQIGDKVVVETEQGLVAGKVTNRCQQCLSQETLRRIIRTFDTNDVRQESRNQAREAEAFIFCRERIEARQLPMKLIGVEYLHGGNKATFYFTAENRIDFRELVKDLAQRFHTRIIMRQIGVRDESKMLGGIGSCGCELCCACWLSKFEPVSIRMAKDQNLVLNPQKVSGQCGRLKCCLTYEERQYQEARKKLPRPGRSVQTPDGLGRVHELDVLRCIVRVRFEDGAIKSYPVDRLDPVQMSELDAMEDGIDSVAIESDA